MLTFTKGPAETILVVDDNETVLKVVVKILEAANFRVYSAANGPFALKLASQTTETIDLLLSDVEMPEMSGPALGEALKAARPNIHVMLMSGAANGNLLVLNYGWAYVQKPFVATKLVQMVNDVLHSKNRSQLGGYEFDCRKDHEETKSVPFCAERIRLRIAVSVAMEEVFSLGEDARTAQHQAEGALQAHINQHGCK
ncbi:MAG: response regulator [Bryobacteraceae bacterium]|jgi:DNA-binding NtrC family response regulator